MSNFHIPYNTEREGQKEFFDNFGIPYNDDASVLIDNTDGVYNGCIFEFKLSISNLNKVLLQAIKYLSRMRIKGESVPATILLVDLNATTAYVYRSQDYFAEIHTVYSGAASKNNTGFAAGAPVGKYDYSDMLQSSQLKHILTDKKAYPDEMYMPVNIDENCIVGWAERYYSEMPKASKGDFLGDDTGTAVKVTGEIRDPRHFKGLINPYTGKTNEKFKYLMDCLNDRLSKKDLGAFYTPEPYAKKAAELVQMAVERVPEGNDYIILDRCAGTGNLESALIGLYDRHGDELISHCVVSTYEYFEWKVLMERIGDKVRDIIPPTEANVVYENGKVANADAMSEDFINNPIIDQYIKNPRCAVILLETPPYQDSGSINFYDVGGDINNRAKTNRKQSFVAVNYKIAMKSFNEKNSSSQELSNLFIWSGFHYYLRQPTDSYIVFSPVKYFKSTGIVNKHLIKAYLFNRKYFHATESSISCVLWSNEDADENAWAATVVDIKDDICVKRHDVCIQKCFSTITALFGSPKSDNDVVTDVACSSDGFPIVYVKNKGRQPIFNTNIIGYIEATAYPIAALSRALVRCNLKHGLDKGEGYHLRRDNYLEMLPLWTAKLFPQDNWYEKDVYFTTSDGGDAYTKDPQFLKSCLIYTCLSNQNKCLSFRGSDGRDYQNELCLDNSKTAFTGMPVPVSAIEELPLALKDLNRYAMNPATRLDDEEQALMSLWRKIMEEARKTANYDPHWNYGVYQITKELNTYEEIGTGRSKKLQYHYPELNGDLETLRKLLKDYYKNHITAKMFEYELLK